MNSPTQILQPLVAASEAVVPATLWQQHRAMVAVSGGADSVALLRTLIQAARQDRAFDASKIIVGHVDHGVRGADSAADKEFVKRLAKELNVGFDSAELDLAPINGRASASEEVLRDARYGCLKKMARDHDARYLFTGHHRDDQAETILFRIFRGTGLAGLKGIPAIRRDQWLTIVRPLLKVPKSQILAAMTALDQSFCTDATNETSDYSRNFIRNEILKSARDYFGLPVEQAIVRLADHAEDAVALEANWVDAYFAKYPVEDQLEGCALPTQPLASQPSSLIRAILIRAWQDQNWPVDQMTFARWQELARRISSAASEPYVENLPGDLRFEVDSSYVHVRSMT